MKLYLKQKFSLKAKYKIYNESQKEIYNAEGGVFQFVPKILLTNSLGEELYLIKQKISFMKGRFEIYNKDSLTAVLEQAVRFFTKKVTIKSTSGTYEINGNAFSYEYNIIHDGIEVCRIRKKILTWADTYELDISDQEDPAFISALVVAIDLCYHKQNG